MPFPACVARASIIVTILFYVPLIAMFVPLTASLLLLCRSVQEGVLSRGTLSAVTAEPIIEVRCGCVPVRFFDSGIDTPGARIRETSPSHSAPGERLR